MQQQTDNEGDSSDPSSGAEDCAHGAGSVAVDD
jgi:hypothetical protein